MAAARLGRVLAGGRVQAARKRLARWGQPVRVIVQDYVDVARDAFGGMKSHPIRTALQFALAGGVVATWVTRPDVTSYRDCVLSYSNDLFQCSAAVRNPHTHDYVTTIADRLSRDLFFCVNLGLLAVIVEREGGARCKNYHVTCRHVRARWWSVWGRVVDVGVWGRWWKLAEKVRDLDVNEEELQIWLQEQKKF